MSSRRPEANLPAKHGRVLEWLLLACGSAVAVALFELAGLPAAFLIGPMLAGVAAGVRGFRIRPPDSAFAAAQALIGCLIAASLSSDIFPAFAENWALFIGAVVSTVLASSFLGWLISRWRILPGTTAVWGSAPGAATAMVLMAGAFGADQRLVAFMQYLRVIMVTIGAALIARIWVDTGGMEAPATVWFPAIEPVAFGATLFVVAAGSALGWLTRLPSPFFLGSFILGTLLHLGFGVEFQLPEWLLATAYVLVGWTIGLKFDRAILSHALRALPQLVLSILALMLFCGGIAWLISHQFGVDPLSAYLATSPGGMDSVAIIAAASSGVDVSFIMTMQAMRFLLVLAFGGPLARLVAGWVKPPD